MTWTGAVPVAGKLAGCPHPKSGGEWQEGPAEGSEQAGSMGQGEWKEFQKGQVPGPELGAQQPPQC